MPDAWLFNAERCAGISGYQILLIVFMSKTLKMGLWILVILIIVGALLAVAGSNILMKDQNMSATSTITGGATDYRQTSAGGNQTGSVAAAQPSGDAGIDKDMAAIEADMSAFNSSSANADKGLNDKAVPQE